MPVQLHPRISMFLEERDRARVRGDQGVIRSLTADLLRLGVPADATLANPTGKHGNGNGNGHADGGETATATVAPKRKGGRPRLPRCEHDAIAERCPICNELEDDPANDPRESDPEPPSDAPQSVDRETVAGDDAALTGPQED